MRRAVLSPDEDDGHRRVAKVSISDDLTDSLGRQGVVDIAGVDGLVQKDAVAASHLDKVILVTLIPGVVVAHEDFMHDRAAPRLRCAAG